MLAGKTRIELVRADVFDHQVDRRADKARLQNLENIGNDYKQQPRDQPPDVFDEKFIKVGEMLHFFESESRKSPEVRKIKSRLMASVFQVE